MPPALQIDIPPEQAQHILEKRKELGPYIFREAQVVVFLCVHQGMVHTVSDCMAQNVCIVSVHVDVSVQRTVEVLAWVSTAEQQRPRGATPSSAAGETSQTQSQSEETEEKRGGRGGGGRAEESSREEIIPGGIKMREWYMLH